MKDWFKDRFETAKEALTVKRVFAIGAIAAVATFAMTYMPQIEWRGKPILDVPSWTWGVIGALVAVIYFLWEYANTQRLALVPKVKLSFDKNHSCIVQTPEQSRLGQHLIETKATYVNIRANALSSATVKECSAFLTGN
jgi:hypothetical protein